LKKYLISGLKLAVSLGLGIGLIYWFVSKMSPADKDLTVDTFKRANYFWILLAPVLGLISNFSRAQRWRQLLQPMGYMPGFWNTWFSITIMYLFNLFFPRLGEVSRCGVLARYENVPLDKSIGTMVVERIVDLLSILIIGAIMLVVEYDRLYAYFDANVLNKQAAPAAEADFTKWIVLTGIAAVLVGAAVYIEVKYGFKKLQAVMKERLMGFAEGLKSIKNVKSPMEFIFHSVFIWICYLLMVYVSFWALPETSSLGLFAATACLFFGGFAMVATPGGIGAYPAVIGQVLLLYAIQGTIGYAFGSIVWAAQMGSILVGGLISLVLLAILNRESALEKEPLKA
jgi:glycosyltransferase 2 family protein